jgi:uncharacterized protein (UPF0548 family)
VGGPTYAEVGATLGELPDGYHHLRRSAVLGRGEAVFARASEALLTWQAHRRAGLRVEADAPRAVLAATVRLGLGLGPLRLWAACRVVRVVDEPAARGFAYGALPGHPEQGEEAFVVRLAPDGEVRLDVVAFSRPARWWSRLGGLVTRWVQERVTRRYLAALVER